ncbi:MFS transporter [Hassallia byssoidea VB512170]|uniref:MFS transporter n=1 Tax=Hassallia byssoidea VB512170 TaxID=1304833 RepID=A0A846HHN8_9CYAN|nr:MFS transporter [Hassalia byssoidea VB512170]
MRTLIIVWLGQIVSIIGSGMTGFAFTIWVWELTGEATSLALFGFFAQVPQILIIPIAGVIVDRWNRKYLMMVGDTVSGLLTITVLLLYITHNLQLWHLYLAVGVKGTFNQFQELAFSASVSMMVPKQQYSRASSISFLASSSSTIVAPALAGVLYAVIGLVGILIIDITTFAIALLTVLLISIPQPPITKVGTRSSTSLKQELYFGWRYVAVRPSLLAMLVLVLLFVFADKFADSLVTPLILARTGNDTKLLGAVYSAAGLGGIIGALLVGTWGSFQPRIHAVLLGMVGAGLSQTVFGLGRVPLIWFPAQFCSSLNFPIMGSAHDAIWLTKVKPELQGRVFAMRSMVMPISSALANLIAGPLADRVFVPAMKPDGTLAPMFGWIFGTGGGAGIALLYVISSLGMLVVGGSGYAFRVLRDVEIILPDYDASAE